MSEAARGGGRVGGSWLEATARERVANFVDRGSFREVLGPEQRLMSPHLPLFAMPRAFDDGVIVGTARLGGRDILLAAQEGQFMGGTFGEVGGAKITGLLRAALAMKKKDAGSDVIVCLLLDTGGVRLQEANAGELAIAEIMRAIIEARAAGVRIIGLIGGRAGCFGGGSLVAATCGKLAISEHGRIGVTGPEVIETNAGAEEFDSKDRALVWRMVGGRNRRLIGAADLYVEDSFEAFRAGAILLCVKDQPFDGDRIVAEQTRLEERLDAFGECGEAADMWRALGLEHAERMSDLPEQEFQHLVAHAKGSAHDAR